MRARKCVISDGRERAREANRNRGPSHHHRKRLGSQLRDALANGNGADGGQVTAPGKIVGATEVRHRTRAGAIVRDGQRVAGKRPAHAVAAGTGLVLRGDRAVDDVAGLRGLAGTGRPARLVCTIVHGSGRCGGFGLGGVADGRNGRRGRVVSFALGRRSALTGRFRSSCPGRGPVRGTCGAVGVAGLG